MSLNVVSVMSLLCCSAGEQLQEKTTQGLSMAAAGLEVFILKVKRG